MDVLFCITIIPLQYAYTSTSYAIKNYKTLFFVIHFRIYIYILASNEFNESIFIIRNHSNLQDKYNKNICACSVPETQKVIL